MRCNIWHSLSSICNHLFDWTQDFLSLPSPDNKSKQSVRDKAIKSIENADEIEVLNLTNAVKGKKKTKKEKKENKQPSAGVLKVQKDGNIDKENGGAVAPSFGGDENKQKGSGKKKGREKNKEDDIENIMSKMLEEDFRTLRESSPFQRRDESR